MQAQRSSLASNIYIYIVAGRTDGGADRPRRLPLRERQIDRQTEEGPPEESDALSVSPRSCLSPCIAPQPPLRLACFTVGRERSAAFTEGFTKPPLNLRLVCAMCCYCYCFSKFVSTQRLNLFPTFMAKSVLDCVTARLEIPICGPLISASSRSKVRLSRWQEQLLVSRAKPFRLLSAMIEI